MRLFLEENLVTGNTLTPDGVLAYIALRKMVDENIFLKSLEITEDCVSINRMAYTLVGVSEKYPKAFTDALQRGIYELDAVDRIKIVQSFGKGIEFVLDIKNLYFDTSKEGQHFVMVSSDEVERILTHDADMKKKISILKYYVALVSSFDWSANMKCKDSMPNLQGKIGHMTQDYVGGLAGISGRTCQRYNVVLEDEMKMIYIYRSNDKIKEDDSLRQITNCYSRYEDKDLCEMYSYDEDTIRKVYKYVTNKNKTVIDEIDKKQSQKYMSSSDKDYVKNLQSQIRDTLIFEQFTYLNEDSQDGNSDEDVWGEIDAIENGYTVEEILEMPTASDVVA